LEGLFPDWLIVFISETELLGHWIEGAVWKRWSERKPPTTSKAERIFSFQSGSSNVL